MQIKFSTKKRIIFGTIKDLLVSIGPILTNILRTLSLINTLFHSLYPLKIPTQARIQSRNGEIYFLKEKMYCGKMNRKAKNIGCMKLKYI